jgi:hypothetical protein
MNIATNLVCGVAGLAIAGLVAHFLFQVLSPKARDQRKRQRNYGKVITRARRPVVMLNVRSPKS